MSGPAKQLCADHGNGERRIDFRSSAGRTKQRDPGREQRSFDGRILNQLYRAALVRPPSAEELALMRGYVDARPDRRIALQDVAWAVLNSNEFLLRR